MEEENKVMETNENVVEQPVVEQPAVSAQAPAQTQTQSQPKAEEPLVISSN